MPDAIHCSLSEIFRQIFRISPALPVFKVRAALQLMGKRRADLASHTGYCEQRTSTLLNQRNPPDKFKQSVAELFGVKASDIWGGGDD